MKQYTPSAFKDFHLTEHDACGILSVMGKVDAPKRKYVDMVIDGLCQIEHRAGFVRGEGDGTGVHMDLPFLLWEEKLKQKNVDGKLASEPQFVVGHFFLTQNEELEASKAHLLSVLNQFDLEVVADFDDVVDVDALGPIGRKNAPLFWQVGLKPKSGKDLGASGSTLLQAVLEIERNLNIHVASLSADYVVYKVLGDSQTLKNYYKDLASPLLKAVRVLGHNRFSTNTTSSFFRVQPFSILGHNGEINTIDKLRREAELIGVKLVDNGSDSQDLNRTLESLLVTFDFNLFEAMDVLFPPIHHEIELYDDALKSLYQFIRKAWGHFAQGPAGIISRFKNEAIFSVDALGLRPVWKIETADAYLFGSEAGVVSPHEYVAEPKPLAPGEKIGLRYEDGKAVLYNYQEIQAANLKSLSGRLPADVKWAEVQADVPVESSKQLMNGDLVACGWNQEHIKGMVKNGAEPVRSLGYDTPLAALDNRRRNVADFLKETIAVVTNPAIDRDRETEHFSLKSYVGERPSLTGNAQADSLLELEVPLIADVGIEGLLVSQSQLEAAFAKTITLSMSYMPEQSLKEGLADLKQATVRAATDGAHLIILDDADVFEADRLWIDPHIGAATVLNGLKEEKLLRGCSIIVRSASIRSLHDLMLLYGLGVGAVNPYGMFQLTANVEAGVENLYRGLEKGISKVISTMGIHELRGYGRLFSAIGLHEEIAEILQIANFFGSDASAYRLDFLDQDARARQLDLGEERKYFNPTRTLMKLWKAISFVADGGEYADYEKVTAGLEEATPSTIRHLLAVNYLNTTEQSHANISIDGHDLPFVISSMSFGSQGETAFLAYAKAAQKLNMLSLNGEGGEHPDLLGFAPFNRGIQVASGRFGISAELLNSANFIEIKISQGAKPGEGGHLPSAKVTESIAAARNVTIGTDLLSPSNNHDIYSIEDLEQIITEMKTINPHAKVIVKVAIVPNICTIVTGVVKAGADIVNLSGFDGGTGAARIHAITHAGLPVEIGIKAAHNALKESGIRDQVELWADGGVRSPEDVLKLMLLGANRIGFGTLAMIAVGCTTCRGCHLDTCHVGIATQISSPEQAKERGLRRFVPRDADKSVQRLINFFHTFGEALAQKVGALGYDNLQELVGRTDLLTQNRGRDLLDLSPLFHEIADVQGQSFIPKNTVKQENDAPCASDRVLVTPMVHERTKAKTSKPTVKRYTSGSAPGNGFAAYNGTNVYTHVHGLSGDGVGKTSTDGGIYILKEKGADGQLYGGSVGKGFAYGASAGSSLYVQGDADARAGIRLSGADVIIGGRLKSHVPALENGHIATRANIKGFAFEYMTGGRGLVLGDPGPWICSGMTGGTVYLYHNPAVGLTEAALRSRLAKGANVILRPVTQKGINDVRELLNDYQSILLENDRIEDLEFVAQLLEETEQYFYEIVPKEVS